MKTKLPFGPPKLTQFMDACWFESYFSKEEVALLNDRWDEENKQTAEVAEDGQHVPTLRQSSVTFVEPGEEDFQWFMHRLSEIAINVNHQRYNFDLLGFYEPIQIAEYTEGDFFDWHMDFTNESASNRKLSISIQLSEPSAYEGGDLEFMVNTKHICAPKTPGTVIVFPSFIQHRVTPITKGSRRSVVGWVNGAPFK